MATIADLTSAVAEQLSLRTLKITFRTTSPTTFDDHAMGNECSTLRRGSARNRDKRSKYKTPSPPPLLGDGSSRRNFPLPRELRDCVYKYLLDGEDVITARHRERETTAHGYRFNTNILAVNKEIHAEATKYLHEHNLFVQITYRWPQLETLKHDFDVPIVTENAQHIKNSTVVGFDYSIAHPDANGATLTQTTPLIPGTFLMLARDFPSFVRTMQWQVRQINWTTFLTVRRGLSLYDICMAGRSGTSVRSLMTPILQDCHNIKRMQVEVERLIMLQSRIVIPDRRTTFDESRSRGLGSGTERLIGSLNKSTRIQNVRVEGLLWATIDLVQSFKKSADEMVSQGNYKIATKRFTTICNAVDNWPWLHRRYLSFVLSNEVCRSAFRVLFQLILDCRIMASRLYFRLRDATNGRTQFAAVSVLVNNVRVALPDSSLLWTDTFFEAFMSNIPVDLVIADLAVQKEESRLREAFGLSADEAAGSSSDTVLFARILSDDLDLSLYENAATTEEILEKMSIGNDPVQVFDTPIPYAVLAQKPAETDRLWFNNDEVYEE